jgi:hypothetical protein
MMKKTIGIFIVIFFKLNAQTYDGLTIFSSFSISSKNTVLIDNNQNVVNTWVHTNSPASHPYLLPDTSIIYPYRVQEPFLDGGAGGVGGGIQRILSNGTIIWNYIISDSIYQHHHDIEVLPNGNILILVWERKSAIEAESVGRQIIESELNEVWAPAILELEPETGNISWEWHMWNHLIQNVDTSLTNYGNISENHQLMDINYGIIGSIGGANGDWMHINSIDYNAMLDQIVISSRSMNEFYIIDHSTTIEEAVSHTGGLYGKGGDFLYRWGNPEVYDMGSEENRQLFGQHDVNWIEDNTLGTGVLILFNNGVGRPDSNYSTTDIIIPSIDDNGNYLMSSNSIYLPDSLINVYCEMGFFSGRQSSAQRLPNGNTLITSSAEQHIFEINAEGDITWEITSASMDYINKASKYSTDYFTDVSISEDFVIRPEKFRLIQNSPNPFNPVTTLRYDLPEQSTVNIIIYDMLGRQVRTLLNQTQDAGFKSVIWDATNDYGKPVSAGVYLYKIQAGEFVQTRKMVLMK